MTVYLVKISGVVHVRRFIRMICVYHNQSALTAFWCEKKNTTIHPFWSLLKQSVKAHICIARHAFEPFGHDPK